MENCYILYSCDGSFEPILSQLNQLSGYTGDFVSIIINSPGEPYQTCFFVQYLGQFDCEIVYDITIDGDIQCNCDTFCYFVQYDETPKQTIYVNGSNDVIVEIFPTGQTVNFCSKIYPIFDSTGDTPTQIVDSCVGNNCPTTLPSIARSNECDVITIFPMGVECIVNNPTNSQTFDGSAQLYITGGTPPYTIFWEVGSYAPALTNLGVGTYNATVSDFYGDFIIDTTCVLEAEVLTYSAMCFEIRGKGIQGTQYVTSQFAGIQNTKPFYYLSLGLTSIGVVFWDGLSQTWVFCLNFACNSNQYYQYLVNNGDYPISSISNQWSAGTSTNYTILSSTLGECDPPVPVITYGNLCANFVIQGQADSPDQQLQVQLIYDGNVNGQPTWQSADEQYYIYWNTGSTPNQWILTGQGDPSTTSIVNNYPTAPPLSNWQILGNGGVKELTIVNGNCISATTVNFTVTSNDASCNDSGSIMINAYGGIAPFEYSIDNGTTYSNVPYFQNLSPGSYNVLVVDSNNNVGQQIITLLGGPVTTYQLGYAVTNSGDISVIAPVLPNGVTISFDIVHTSTLSYYPNNVSPTPQYNNTLSIVGYGGLSLYNTATNFSLVTGPCTLITPIILKTQITNTYKSNFTLSSGQTLSGTTTNQVLFAPTGQCQGSQGTFQIQIENVKMNGCSCCEVQIVNF